MGTPDRSARTVLDSILASLAKASDYNRNDVATPTLTRLRGATAPAVAPARAELWFRAAMPANAQKRGSPSSRAPRNRLDTHPPSRMRSENGDPRKHFGRGAIIGDRI